MKALRYTILILALLIGVAGASAITAKDIVTNCSNKLNDAQSVTASYTFRGTDISGKGSITLAGNKFKMSIGDIRYWYNGKSLWSYFPSSEEVYLSEPTADELAEINPVSLLNSISTQCDYTALKAPACKYKVRCTAKNNSVPFKTMTVTVSSQSYLPELIVLETRQGDTVTLTLTSTAIGKAVKASMFNFNAKEAPAAQLIDMR